MRPTYRRKVNGNVTASSTVDDGPCVDSLRTHRETGTLQTLPSWRQTGAEDYLGSAAAAHPELPPAAMDARSCWLLLIA